MKLNKLTQSEEYVLKHIEDDINYFISNNLKTLSIKYNVGEATLIRLIKKLNFSSLKDMQINFSSKIKINELTKIYPIINNENITNNVSSFEIYSILETKSLIDQNQLEQAVIEIINSKNIVLFGIENSYISALFLANNLQKIGQHNTIYQSVHGCITQMNFMPSDESILIIYCSSGTTKECLEVAKQAFLKNIKVIWIASINSKGIETVLQNSNFILYHSFHKNETLRFPSISSSSGQIFISNLIFNLIINKDQLIFEKLKDSNNILKNWNKN